jgi:hypothetical protein
MIKTQYNPKKTIPVKILDSYGFTINIVCKPFKFSGNNGMFNVTLGVHRMVNQIGIDHGKWTVTDLDTGYALITMAPSESAAQEAARKLLMGISEAHYRMERDKAANILRSKGLPFPLNDLEKL